MSAKVAKKSKASLPKSSAAAAATSSSGDSLVRKAPTKPVRIETTFHACDAPLVCDGDALGIADQASYERSNFVHQAAKRLYERGAVSFEISKQSLWTGQETEMDFHTLLRTSRLFRHKPHEPSLTPEHLPVVYAGGSFGGVGSPELDHHPIVRRWREAAHLLCVPVLGQFVQCAGLSDDYKVAQFPDRLLYRPPHVVATGESWHRDVAPFTRKGDLVLGGWINTSSYEQHFSFIATSHLGANDDSSATHGDKAAAEGFALAGDDDMAEAARLVAANPTCAARIRVPPGGILLFFENCLHEVLKGHTSHAVRRLFISFHLTRTNKGLFDTAPSAAQLARIARSPTLTAMGKERAARVLATYESMDTMMAKQATVPLKSAQPRLMYPHRWWMPRSLRYLIVMSASITSVPTLRDHLFEWHDTTEKQRAAVQRACTPDSAGYFDSDLVKALVVLSDRGDLPGATRTAMLPARIRVVRQVWPALADLPVEYRHEPATPAHLSMFTPATHWEGLTSPWFDGPRTTSVDLYHQQHPHPQAAAAMEL